MSPDHVYAVSHASSFPIPHSPFPIPHSPFPIPHSPFPIPHALCPLPCLAQLPAQVIAPVSQLPAQLLPSFFPQPSLFPSSCYQPYNKRSFILIQCLLSLCLALSSLV
eukprot:superscaffoldBa00000401_g4431